MAVRQEASDWVRHDLLDRAAATRLTRTAIESARREYPHQLDHVLAGAGSVRAPRDLHPAFYGSYDWHSAVHNHWLLVYALRRWPDAPTAHEAVALLDEHLDEALLARELAYFEDQETGAAEGPYGWAWLALLDAELVGVGVGVDAADIGGAPRGQRWRAWRAAVAPLARLLAERCLAGLENSAVPTHEGRHRNSAFALSMLLAAARMRGDDAQAERIGRCALRWFAGPGTAVPEVCSAQDFFSPLWTVADLLARLLPATGFASWFGTHLGADRDAVRGRLADLDAVVGSLPEPTAVGLRLSLAWCLEQVAATLDPEADPRVPVLRDAARRWVTFGLEHAVSGRFIGDHWLPTFAMYIDARRGCRRGLAARHIIAATEPRLEAR